MREKLSDTVVLLQRKDVGNMYYIGLIFGILVLLCLIILIKDSNRFIIKYYRIKDAKIKGCHKYVFLSDLHNKQYGEHHQKLIEAIQKVQPEAVLIGGDILTAKPGKPIDIAVDFVKQVSELFPVYYANGNHEYRIGVYPETYGDMHERYTQAISETKAIRLVNESVFFAEANIKVSGLDINREYYSRFKKKEMEATYISKRLGEKDADMYQILMAHNPEHMDAYAAYGADLVLSGHIHGGVADLPYIGGVISPSFRFFPEYDGGFFQKDGTSMILSRGLGSHTIPLRFMNPAELVVIGLYGVE